jgi:hypothetical protein
MSASPATASASSSEPPTTQPQSGWLALGIDVGTTAIKVCICRPLPLAVGASGVRYETLQSCSAPHNAQIEGLPGMSGPLVLAIYLLCDVYRCVVQRDTKSKKCLPFGSVYCSASSACLLLCVRLCRVSAFLPKCMESCVGTLRVTARRWSLGKTGAVMWR